MQLDGGDEYNEFWAWICLGFGLRSFGTKGLRTGLDSSRLRFSLEAKAIKEWGLDGEFYPRK